MTDSMLNGEPMAQLSKMFDPLLSESSALEKCEELTKSLKEEEKRTEKKKQEVILKIHDFIASLFSKNCVEYLFTKLDCIVIYNAGSITLQLFPRFVTVRKNSRLIQMNELSYSECLMVCAYLLIDGDNAPIYKNLERQLRSIQL